MAQLTSQPRRALLGAGALLVAAALAGPAMAYSPPPSPGLAQVDVYDRMNGAALPVYSKDGVQYIVGVPGHEYAVRIRNCTGSRILAVTSVDGVNVISGETAAPAQSGYVIEPWGSVEIAGWRKNMSRTAAFFFTEHSNSYAARTGRPFDVGVIGVAVFAERIARPAQRISEAQPSRDEAKRADKAEASAEAPAAPAAQAASNATGATSDALREDAPSRERRQSIQPMAKLGTGHGRSEASYARQVAFERATSEAAQVVAIQYDRHENLVALGVLPAASPHFAQRAPRPFPGLRFAPDPR